MEKLYKEGCSNNSTCKWCKFQLIIKFHSFRDFISFCYYYYYFYIPSFCVFGFSLIMLFPIFQIKSLHLFEQQTKSISIQKPELLLLLLLVLVRHWYERNIICNFYKPEMLSGTVFQIKIICNFPHSWVKALQFQFHTFMQFPILLYFSFNRIYLRCIFAMHNLI